VHAANILGALIYTDWPGAAPFGFKGADFDLSFSMSSYIFPYCKWWFSKPLGAIVFRVHESFFAVSM